ncbi:peptide chain release factor 2 [Candidatus Dependentiae bacterium]|nr:peptide chain release factor 2 [Candidatus Dependentiae bacterium]
MLVDELREKIKNTEPDIKVIQSYWENSGLEQEFQRLHTLSTQEEFWQNPQQAEILKELQRVRLLRDSYTEVMHSHAEFPELLDLFETDEQELAQLREDIFKWARIAARFKISLLLSDEQDKVNCFLSVNSGAGGTESQDWAEILLRMFVRFAERENMNAQVLDFLPGEGAGIKSATLFIKAKNAYGLLKGEQGIHRLVRISPFDASKRRHTSFAAVTVTPEVPDVEITIDPKDLRIDTYRAGGAGGQHVNKTDSAVRITHLPTNIVVQCQNERSQMQNKEIAMKMLMAKLVQKEKDEKKSKSDAIEKKKIEWGSQIRSYVLHPYKMVKDHRTDFESPQPDLVLDGDLMEFIEAYLLYTHTQT